MPKWVQSIRAISVLLVLILLFVVVIGSMIGASLPSEVLALVGSVVTGVVIAYFGKRESSNNQQSDQ